MEEVELRFSCLNCGATQKRLLKHDYQQTTRQDIVLYACRCGLFLYGIPSVVRVGRIDPAVRLEIVLNCRSCGRPMVNRDTISFCERCGPSNGIEITAFISPRYEKAVGLSSNRVSRITVQPIERVEKYDGPIRKVSF